MAGWGRFPPLVGKPSNGYLTRTRQAFNLPTIPFASFSIRLISAS